MAKLYIDLYAEKHLGREQELNEDSVFSVSAGATQKLSPEILAALGVADGMGGPDGGVVASTIAIEYLASLFTKGGNYAITQQLSVFGVDYPALINQTFHVLNKKIAERAATLHGKGPIGTTCVFGLITYNAQDDKTYLHVGNVGNSRCYIIRGDQIFHATEDDTHAWQMYKKGEITYAEMLVHPLRLVSTSIGVKEAVTPQVHSIELLQNDLVLFCTDGLHDIIDDTEIEYVVNSSSNTREAVQGLVAAAKAAGGDDDIALALAYCSAKPMEINAGFAEEVHAPGMAKRTKLLIGIGTTAVVLVLAAIAAYVMNPSAAESVPPFPSAPVVVQKDTMRTKSAEAAPVPAVEITSLPPAPVEIPAVRAQKKPEAPLPQMSVEWNAQTGRFRIRVKTSGAIPVALSYGNLVFDVVPVSSVPNLFRTTVAADSEMLPEKGVVSVRLKAPDNRVVRATITMLDE